MSEQTERVEVVVVGGGPTGLALACALGSAGVPVLLVERRPLAELVEPHLDGRVTAVARGSKLLLDGIGVWERCAGEAGPILEIVVGEGGSPVKVRYEHQAIGDEPLGWIVENRVLRRALVARLGELPSVRVAAPGRIARLERGASTATVELTDGAILHTSLVAAAEGRRSSAREAAGIGVRSWSYGQTGLVATFAHGHPHGGMAIERFFPDGPFAMLPMTESRSSLVWAAAEELARTLQALADADFAAEVQVRLGEHLGDLTLVGRRFAYPLSLSWADAYTALRLVLVGDTARAIHPIAGQGWNLALRDVGAIAETVVDRVRLGLDPGDAVALERYAAWRRFDSLALVAITDGINRLFANDSLPLRLARNLGLAMVERTPLAKGFFMRHAMGLIGNLPRLMRGLPL
jgi:2-octaprenyl-6-methoxyphenol hydroxylase